MNYGEGGLSASDVALLTNGRSGNNDGFGDGNGWWIIIIEIIVSNIVVTIDYFNFSMFVILCYYFCRCAFGDSIGQRWYSRRIDYVVEGVWVEVLKSNTIQLH